VPVDDNSSVIAPIRRPVPPPPLMTPKLWTALVVVLVLLAVFGKSFMGWINADSHCQTYAREHSGGVWGQNEDTYKLRYDECKRGDEISPSLGP
jgi:hypothetical protein